MLGKRILVVEDQALVRESMVMLLQIRIPDLQVLQASTMAQALDGLATADGVDLVSLDLSLPDSQGLASLTRMRDAHPGTPVVVVSANDSAEQVRAAIDAGAASFVSKSADAEAFTQSILRLLQGGLVLPPGTGWEEPTPGGRTADQVRQSVELLSRRQQDVLRLLLLGKPNKVISRELQLSEATVKSHLQAAFRRLDVNSRTQAVIAVARLGLTLQEPSQ